MAQVQEELRLIGEKVDELLTDMATIKARLDVTGPVDQEKFVVLFAARDKHGERIADIERDYVRRTTHDELDKRVSAIEVNFSRHIGMLMAIVAVVNFLGVGGIAAIVYWGMHK